MSKFVNDLRVWREARNINQPNYPVYIKSILEELLEPMYDKKDIKYLVGEIYDGYFSKCERIDLSIDAILDSMNDIEVFTINEIEVMGYDNNLTMDETIKEIDSRVQDEHQKRVWEENGPSGKWQKSLLQSKDTLYVAKYNQCKRKLNDR